MHRLPTWHGPVCLVNSRLGSRSALPRVGRTSRRWHGTINPLSIAYGYHALGLGPANPTRTYLASEPSGYRRAGFPPAFSLLMPASALPAPPPRLPPRLRRTAGT